MITAYAKVVAVDPEHMGKGGPLRWAGAVHLHYRGKAVYTDYGDVGGYLLSIASTFLTKYVTRSMTEC